MFCTRAEVKKYLKIESDETAYDDIIDMLIVSMSTTINNYCHRDFFVKTAEELYDGDDEKELKLDSYPIVALDIVSMDYDIATQVVGTVINLTKIIIKKESGLIYLIDDSFTSGDKNIYIKYRTGYSDGDVPADVKQVCIDSICKKWKDQDAGRFGIESKTVMSENVRFVVSDIAKEHLAILDRYLISESKAGFSLL